MSRKLWFGVAAVAAGAVALAAANYRSVILFAVTQVGREDIAPNREVVWAQGPATPSAGDRPPNVVVILVDDLGFNDISTFGGGVAGGAVPTPNIDALAARGAAMTQAYSGTAACAPSRAMVMTGRYPTRHGFEFTPTPAGMNRILPLFFNDGTQPHPMLSNKDAAAKLPPMADQGLPGSEVTVAEVLKDRGYHTVHIGKWHLGSGKTFGANAQGFDESLLLASALYMPEKDPGVVNAKVNFDPIDKFLWPNMRFGVSYNAGKWFEPNKYITDYFTDQAVTAIQRNKNQPFFLYLAHWGVHTPLQASKEDYDALSNIPDHRRRVYAAMVRSVDRSVGRVLQTLKDEGLDQNTLVVFASDNGAPSYIGIPDVNRPYRGWKLTFFEGGLRVPYVAKWPGHIAAGTQYPQPISNIDMMPTLVAAAGGKMPSDRPIDGVNLLPFLGAKPAVQAARTVFWRDGPHRALRHQQWKLISADLPAKDWLFNLATDPTEKVNLAATEPQKLAELKAELAAHHANMPPPLWASFIKMPITIDKTLNQPAAPGDEYTYWSN